MQKILHPIYRELTALRYGVTMNLAPSTIVGGSIVVVGNLAIGASGDGLGSARMIVAATGGEHAEGNV